MSKQRDACARRTGRFLSRVFGKLLYAMENRGPEATFRLPYSGAEAYRAGSPHTTFVRGMEASS